MTKTFTNNQPSSWRDYYELTKPGIIRGNLLTAAAGFFLASTGHIDIILLLATLAGTAFIIAAGCVCNNYIDRSIDRAMVRTHQRALATGRISARSALVFAAVLGLGGSLILGLYVNPLTLVIGLFGFLSYIGLYGWAKRHTEHGTLIGSISGAVPPVAGYTAVTDRLDGVALTLFLILVAWQMPHFYAIAIYRQKDYAAAKLPVLPVKKGIESTKRQMCVYVVLFGIAASALWWEGRAGYSYLAVALLLCLGWLSIALGGYRSKNTERWARRMFFASLIILPVLSLAIGLGPRLS